MKNGAFTARLPKTWCAAHISSNGAAIGGLVWGFVSDRFGRSNAAWGPWLSELYPPHPRSTAPLIFNRGRVISMTAPLITAPLAEAFGRAPVMSLGLDQLSGGGHYLAVHTRNSGKADVGAWPHAKLGERTAAEIARQALPGHTQAVSKLYICDKF